MLVTLALVPSVDCMAQVVRFSTDVSAGVAVATNPYLQAGPSTAAASGFVEIAPMLTGEDEVSTISLRGWARFEPYVSRYSPDAALSLDLNATRRLSDRLSLRGSAGFRTSRSSAQDILSNQQLSLAPVVGLNPLTTDISFVGQQTRTTSLSAQIGATYRPSAIDHLDLDLGIGQQRFSQQGLADFRNATAEVRYTRSLSERTAVTLGASLGRIDYLGRRAGDATIVTPHIGLEQQLAENLRLSASLGFSHTRLRRVDDSYASQNTLAVSASICQDRVHGKFCVSLDRSSQPTALGDVRNVTSVAAAFTQRFGERDELQVNANFSRTSGSGPAGSGSGGGPATFVGASAEFTRKLSPRLSWFAGASYSDIYQTNNPRRADLQARAGIRIRLGDLR